MEAYQEGSKAGSLVVTGGVTPLAELATTGRVGLHYSSRKRGSGAK